MKLLKLILIAIFLILCGIGIGTDLDNIYPNIAGHTAKWYWLDICQYMVFLFMGICYFNH